MKTTYNPNLRAFVIGLVLLVAMIGSPQPAAAKLYRVAVVPFKINAEKDLSFLQDGITDMLTSRLAWQDKVTVLTRAETAGALKDAASPLNENTARKIGSQLKVDYVLFGSLTVFGNSVSIDAKMVDVSGSKPPLSFFNQSSSMDQVIPGINQFATDINAQIFGRDMPARRVYAQPQTQTSQEAPSYRAHPDKLIAGGFGEIDEPGTPKPAPGAGFLATRESRASSTQFWKSLSLKKRITGVAVGDIDQDGKNEIIIISSRSVEAYRFEKKRFFKVKTIIEHSINNFISVDVADINGNGILEIFISSLNPNRNSINSFVLEFNGQTYTEIVKSCPYYYRVVRHPARGKILLGGKQSVGSLFSGNIFEMTWENGSYQPANQINLPPRRANVLGIALGNAMNDGSEVAVAYDHQKYLRLLDLAGQEIWKDGKHSGGSMEYFVLSTGESSGDDKRDYYPAHIIVRDINRDGKNEVITINNQRVSELLQYHKFTQGEIEIRAWDGIGLPVHWRTRKLSGYFSDIAVGDFDNDGQDELIAALVINPGTVVATTPKSRLIAYELK